MIVFTQLHWSNPFRATPIVYNQIIEYKSRLTNDDPWLTLTNFISRLNLTLGTFKHDFVTTGYTC